MQTVKKIAQEFMAKCTTAGKEAKPDFDYNDLNEVMAMVMRFCESSHPICCKCGAPDNYRADRRFRVMPDFGSRTIYGPPQAKFYADIVQMYEGGHQEIMGRGRNDNLCAALLEACNDSTKKLKTNV